MSVAHDTIVPVVVSVTRKHSSAERWGPPAHEVVAPRPHRGRRLGGVLPAQDDRNEGRDRIGVGRCGPAQDEAVAEISGVHGRHCTGRPELPSAAKDALLLSVSHASTTSTPHARIALAVGAGAVAALLYGGQFVITRWRMQRTLSLWDLAALRFAVAGLLMLPVVLRHGIAGVAGIGWKRSLVLAITAGAPYTLIMQAGLVVAPAAHGAPSSSPAPLRS